MTPTSCCYFQCSSRAIGFILGVRQITVILFSLTHNHNHTEFNDYNSALFNIRARSLNNLVYWIAQIVGSVSIAFLLDRERFGRKQRALAGWFTLVTMVFIVHVWAYFYQRYVSDAQMGHPYDSSWHC